VAGVVSGDLFTATGLDGRTSYAPERAEQLWAQVPDGLRLERYTPETVPVEHLPAFTVARRSPLDLSGLPLGLRREFGWSVAGIVERGGLAPVGPLAMLARHLPVLLEDLRGRGIDAHSLMHFSPSGWEREFQRLALKHGRPELAVKSTRGTLRRIYRPLWIAYDSRPWWQREVWDPHLDTAIPLRAHEPDGEKLLNFLRLEQDWLRAGAQWWFKVSLELERLTWSTLRGFLNALAELWVPRGSRRRGPVAARAPGRSAGVDARLPRRAQEPQGQARTDEGPAAVGRPGCQPHGRDRRVLPVHA
jgi:hypothetical protein